MSDQSSKDARSRFDGVILVVAILLIAAPWLLGYSGDRNATATSLVAGLAICACVVATLIETAPTTSTWAATMRRSLAKWFSGGFLIPKHHPHQADAFWHFWDDKQ